MATIHQGVINIIKNRKYIIENEIPQLWEALGTPQKDGGANLQNTLKKLKDIQVLIRKMIDSCQEHSEFFLISNNAAGCNFGFLDDLDKKLQVHIVQIEQKIQKLTTEDQTITGNADDFKILWSNVDILKEKFAAAIRVLGDESIGHRTTKSEVIRDVQRKISDYQWDSHYKKLDLFERTIADYLSPNGKAADQKVGDLAKVTADFGEALGTDVIKYLYEVTFDLQGMAVPKVREAYEFLDEMNRKKAQKVMENHRHVSPRVFEELDSGLFSIRGALSKIFPLNSSDGFHSQSKGQLDHAICLLTPDESSSGPKVPDLRKRNKSGDSSSNPRPSR